MIRFPLTAERRSPPPPRRDRIDFWPHSFHATPIGSMLKSRIQGAHGGTVYPAPPPPAVLPTMPISLKPHQGRRMTLPAVQGFLRCRFGAVAVWERVYHCGISPENRSCVI